MKFLNRKTSEDEEPLSGSKKKYWCTVGAAINYSLTLNYLALFLTCLVVVGTVGTIQKDLKDDYNDPLNKTGPFCYMYATCNNKDKLNGTKCRFLPDTASECDAALVCYSIIALMALAFSISMLIKAFINQDLNWTLFIELPVLIVAALLEFSLSVMISIGSLKTRKSIEKFGGKRGIFPYSEDVSYGGRATAAENGAWFAFLFIFIALVITIIRLIVYLRRRKQEEIRTTVENEESSDEPKTI